jgi:hypothetical protein
MNVQYPIKLYTVIILLASVVLLTASSLTPLVDFSIDWYSVPGASVKAASTDYRLVGEFGVSGAGYAEGDDFSLDFGFWGAVEAPPPLGRIIFLPIIKR